MGSEHMRSDYMQSQNKKPADEAGATECGAKACESKHGTSITQLHRRSRGGVHSTTVTMAITTAVMTVVTAARSRP